AFATRRVPAAKQTCRLRIALLHPFPNDLLGCRDPVVQASGPFFVLLKSEYFLGYFLDEARNTDNPRFFDLPQFLHCELFRQKLAKRLVCFYETSHLLSIYFFILFAAPDPFYFCQFITD